MTIPVRLRPALVCCLLAAGCAWNPVKKRPEVVLVSRAQEKELGDAEAKRVAEAMGLHDAPALDAYVSTVGQRLAEHAPGHDAYVFHVVDMEEPNAFALPGGHVYVSRGLLAIMNSEDELAGVLGHEIGHVAARHAAARITRAAPFAVVTGLGAAVTGIVSPTLGDVVGGIGGLATGLVLAPYSRGQEHEADRVGQDLAAAAGWDPSGLTRSLATLEREQALHAGQERPMAFFSTHPALPSRVEETEEYARKLTRAAGRPIAGSRAEFVRKLEGLPVGPRPRDGVVEGERFSHPDFGFTLRFPAGWKVQNAREAVGAVAPDRDAIMLLQTAGNGDDPDAALGAFEEKAGGDLRSRAEHLKLGGLPAVRTTAVARTRDGPLALDLTWVAHANRVYRITGATPAGRATTYRPAFQEATATFRPLTAAERGGFRETQLRLVAAHEGETLGALVARAGGTGWDLPMIAVANDIDATAGLRRTQLVKVPRAEPYRPR